MCPLCSSKRVRRSRRRPLDFILMIFGAQPMRCRTCSNRYFRWLWKRSEEDAPPAVSASQPLPEPQKRSVAVGSAGEP